MAFAATNDQGKSRTFVAKGAAESFFGYFFCGKKRNCPLPGMRAGKPRAQGPHHKEEKRTKALVPPLTVIPNEV
ncbi:MAG TPA: hypothetical protein VF273_02835, partial [Pelobium sp.]